MNFIADLTFFDAPLRSRGPPVVRAREYILQGGLACTTTTSDGRRPPKKKIEVAPKIPPIYIDTHGRRELGVHVDAEQLEIVAERAPDAAPPQGV